MSKYWKIGNSDDTLWWFAYAPNKEMAVKVVEDLMGPQNPARRIIHELPSCPAGYAHVDFGMPSQILNSSEDE
jgi:hypothetical protein